MHAGLHVYDERAELQREANTIFNQAQTMFREARSTLDVKMFAQARELYAHAGSAFEKIARGEKSKVEKVNGYFKAGKAYLFAADYKRAGRCFASVRKHFTDVNPDEVDVWDFEMYGYTAITDIFLDNKKHFETYLRYMCLLHNTKYVRTWMRKHFTEVLQSLLPKDRVVFVDRYQEFMKTV
jgi:tetratricopeptide (TPR) repeat protein